MRRAGLALYVSQQNVAKSKQTGARMLFKKCDLRWRLKVAELSVELRKRVPNTGSGELDKVAYFLIIFNGFKSL